MFWKMLGRQKRRRGGNPNTSEPPKRPLQQSTECPAESPRQTLDRITTVSVRPLATAVLNSRAGGCTVSEMLQAIPPTSELKPLLRWAGSKRQHLRDIAARLPRRYNRYIEPFAGSACLFWNLRPNQALLSDLNADLIGCYRAVRDQPDLLYTYYCHLQNSKDTFYQVRASYNSTTDNILKSALFLYLNRYCFNGLFRTNRGGGFNVPYGGKKSGRLPNIDELRRYSAVLRDCELQSGDFETVVRDNVQDGDLVYLDPPFLSESRMFREYTAAPFSRTDIVRLVALLSDLNRCGVYFILSFLDNDEIDLKPWHAADVRVHRRISGFAKGRREVKEVLVSNFAVGHQ
jgi:DNA adenine methylase